MALEQVKEEDRIKKGGKPKWLSKKILNVVQTNPDSTRVLVIF